MTTILHINSSARTEGSHTRAYTQKLIERLSAQNPGADIITRDITEGLEFIDESWVGANFTPAGERSDDQKARLALSDTLVAELKRADHIVIGAPIYNFSVPGALKAWIDLVCRAGETFRYTENGPLGLLEGKEATIIVASGGTEVDGPIDFATGYLRHVLGFIGITDVTTVPVSQTMVDLDAAISNADAALLKAA
ncbi:MAG: NAD(P)H-dependent oxidoreductase [Pseudomonadota bacterium]